MCSIETHFLSYKPQCQRHFMHANVAKKKRCGLNHTSFFMNSIGLTLIGLCTAVCLHAWLIGRQR